MLMVAMLATVVVWFLIQDMYTKNRGDGAKESVSVLEPSTTTQLETENDTEIYESEEEESETPSTVSLEEPIPLHTLPLSETQRSLIGAAGIDVETFVITPEMVSCAKEKLGEGRFNAIVGGEAPSFLEGTKLLGCIR